MSIAIRPSQAMPRCRGKVEIMNKNPALYERKPCANCGALTSNAGGRCARCLPKKGVERGEEETGGRAAHAAAEGT